MRGSDFADFPESNARSACNRRRVSGVGIHYTAPRGYTGPDSVVVEMITPGGRLRRGTFNLYVR